MIKKVRNGYKAATSTGKELSKKPKTRAGAVRQLRAVEANKARRGK